MFNALGMPTLDVDCGVTSQACQIVSVDLNQSLFCLLFLDLGHDNASAGASVDALVAEIQLCIGLSKCHHT